MGNGAEDLAGTNPLDANSVLRILSLANGNLLTWSSVAGRTYRVWSAAAPDASFAPVSGVVPGASPSTSWLDSSATNSSRFYRINALP